MSIIAFILEVVACDATTAQRFRQMCGNPHPFTVLGIYRLDNPFKPLRIEVQRRNFCQEIPEIVTDVKLTAIGIAQSSNWKVQAKIYEYVVGFECEVVDDQVMIEAEKRTSAL